MGKKHKVPVQVLVVDDEENILKSIEVYLRMEGFEVRGAGNGEEALKTLKYYRPDVMVLDLMMPGIDGYEVMSRMGENGDWAAIPVIILTACGRDSDMMKGYKSGAASYMTKPFNLNELVDNINMIISTPGKKEDKTYKI